MWEWPRPKARRGWAAIRVWKELWFDCGEDRATYLRSGGKCWFFCVPWAGLIQVMLRCQSTIPGRNGSLEAAVLSRSVIPRLSSLFWHLLGYIFLVSVKELFGQWTISHGAQRGRSYLNDTQQMDLNKEHMASVSWQQSHLSRVSTWAWSYKQLFTTLSRPKQSGQMSF